MSSEKFIQNKLALTTLICACVVVLMSLSVRQVFGMFFIDFNNDLGISNTEFGLAIGIQMLGWGLSGPIFGVLADKYGGHKSIIIAFLFYILGVYFLYAGPNTGIYFQISLGVLIGIGCGGTAISNSTSFHGAAEGLVPLGRGARLRTRLPGLQNPSTVTESRLGRSTRGPVLSWACFVDGARPGPRVSTSSPTRKTRKFYNET